VGTRASSGDGEGRRGTVAAGRIGVAIGAAGTVGARYAVPIRRASSGTASAPRANPIPHPAPAIAIRIAAHAHRDITPPSGPRNPGPCVDCRAENLLHCSATPRSSFHGDGRTKGRMASGPLGRWSMDLPFIAPPSMERRFRAGFILRPCPPWAWGAFHELPHHLEFSRTSSRVFQSASMAVTTQVTSSKWRMTDRKSRWTPIYAPLPWKRTASSAARPREGR